MRSYISLTKPGIVFGNLITAAGGFGLGVHGSFDVVSFLAMLIGLSLVVGASSVFNNYLDRDMDAKMERTKHRALVEGKIPLRHALTFGASLMIIGVLVLLTWTNTLTTIVSLMWFLAYVIFYSLLWKRTYYGTHVGTLSGVVPPLAGYAASAGVIDGASVILFVILAIWQLPHFYAIATYRLEDYKAARVPVLPAVRGIYVTKIQTTLHIVAYALASSLLTIFGYSGFTYLTTVGALSLWWLVVAFQGFSAIDNERWGRRMFKISLIVLTIQFAVLFAQGLVRLP